VAASLRNAAAVADWLSRQHSPVSVIAAGERWNDGTWRFAVEDLIGAGALIARLSGRCSPEAESARAAFEHARPELLPALRNCSSGRELVERGFDADVALAAELDVDRAVPTIIDRAFRPAS
jgi:2-phosphosulfolactate phosphatase